VVQVAELTTDAIGAALRCCEKRAATALPILVQQGAYRCDRAVISPWQDLLELVVWDVLVPTAVRVESLFQLQSDRVLATLTLRARCGCRIAAGFGLFLGLGLSLRLGLSSSSSSTGASQLRIPWAEMTANARLSIFAALLPVVLAWQLAGEGVPHRAQRRRVIC